MSILFVVVENSDLHANTIQNAPYPPLMSRRIPVPTAFLGGPYLPGPLVAHPSVNPRSATVPT